LPAATAPMDDVAATMARLEARIGEAPSSAAALVLYSLVKTVSTGRGQYLFLLNKLRDLGPEDRGLAYAVMEAVATGANESPAWREGVARLDALVAGRAAGG